MRSLSLALISFFILTACSGSAPQKEEAPAEPTTDACLADSNLAAEWGECNVKKTIFENMNGLRACQTKHVATASAGTTMMLKIKLRPNGKVQHVRPEAGGVRNRPLEGCLSKVFAKVKFAAPPQGVKPVIYFPLSL
ncbi:MAG: hypothetical protein ACXWQO_11840 [Bdellovibrionota bacterium]